MKTERRDVFATFQLNKGTNVQINSRRNTREPNNKYHRTHRMSRTVMSHVNKAYKKLTENKPLPLKKGLTLESKIKVKGETSNELVRVLTS